MYQKLENLISKKTEKKPKEKKSYIYVWKAAKVHFRGPCEFKVDDKIEILLDKDARKILFVKINGEGSKYTKKFAIISKTGNIGGFSMKKAFEILNFNETAVFESRKVTDEELKALSEILPDIGDVGYEIDLNNPIKNEN